MSDGDFQFRWPGGEAEDETPTESVMITVDEFISLLDGRSPHRLSETPVPGPESYDLGEHLPYGHTAGQHVLDPGAGTEGEERLRRRVGAFILDLLDRGLPESVRIAALAKALTEDGPRALGLLTTLLNEAWDEIDRHHKMPPGTSLRVRRESLEGN